MSIPTLQGLQTALSGLIAEQAALDVTGNNIANSDTEGYSRETAVLQTNEPITIPAISPLTGEGAQLGTGVSVATITRVRNIYLDAQYRTQNSALSEASTQSEELTQAQSGLQRTLELRSCQPDLGFLGRLERTRQRSHKPSRQAGSGGRRRIPSEHIPRTQRATLDDLDPGRPTVRGPQRTLRRSPERRQPDRSAQRPDQARRTSRARSRTRCSTGAISCSTSSRVSRRSP